MSNPNPNPEADPKPATGSIGARLEDAYKRQDTIVGKMKELTGVLPDGKGWKSDTEAGWDEDKAKQFSDLKAEMEKIKPEVARLEALREVSDMDKSFGTLRENAEARAVLASQNSPLSVDELTQKQIDWRQDLKAWAASGQVEGQDMPVLESTPGLDPRRLINARQGGSLMAAAARSTDMGRGAGSTSSTDGPKGGYATADYTYAGVIEVMQKEGRMRSFCRHDMVSTGNKVSYPTYDPTQAEGQIIRENSSLNHTAMTIGQTSLEFDQYATTPRALSEQLLQDSVFDFASWVDMQLVDELIRYQEGVFMNGSTEAADKVEGIVEAVNTAVTLGAGKLTAAALTIQDLTDLAFAVDEAYHDMGRCRYLMNKQTLAAFASVTSATDGRPIWIENTERGIYGGMLRGFPVEIHRRVPSAGANAKSILFGDFMYYMICDASGFELSRYMDSNYRQRKQVGFQAFIRSAGKFIDGNTGSTGGAVQALAHPAA